MKVDAEEGNKVALRRADQPTHRQTDERRWQIVPFVVDHQHRSNRADKTDDGADRQVDVSRHDDQQHA